MKKKAWLIAVSAVLVLTLAITGTIAYLTDRDSDVNVFTWGNVDITLNEDFQQGASLIPGKDIKKNVTISNVGKSNAWVWVKIAIPSALDDDDASKNVIHFNYNKQAVDAGQWNWKKNGQWNMAKTTIDNVEYNVYTVQYQTVLKPGDTTATSAMTKVYLDKAVDIDPDGNLHKVVNGVVTDIEWNINTDGVPMMYVSAYATQEEGFDTVEAANAAYDTQWGDNGDAADDVVVPTVVYTADELIEALENGEDVILGQDIKIDPAGMSNAYGTTGINVKNGQTIYGGGNTLDIKGAGGTWDSGINTTGGLIKDITVTGSFRGIFINHNSTYSERIVLEKVVIDGTTYTISCDQGKNQGLTANDSTFNGWTSYANTIGDVEFNDCTFGKGGGYAFCRPYAPTVFVGCAFEAGYKMDPRAAVVFEDCTIGGEPLTADNLGTLVTSRIENATVR